MPLINNVSRYFDDIICLEYLSKYLPKTSHKGNKIYIQSDDPMQALGQIEL